MGVGSGFHMYDVVVKQLLFLPRFQNILLVVYDHINTICPLIQHYLGKTNIAFRPRNSQF